MKPKSGKHSAAKKAVPKIAKKALPKIAKKAVPKIAKPAISATTIRKTLKKVIDKDLLVESTSGVRNLRVDSRATNVQSKAMKDKPESSQRRTNNRLQIPNDHGAAGSSHKPERTETSKRQKTSLLEIPQLPTRQGTIFVIGENDVLQLGLDALERQEIPAELQLKVPIVDIAAGGMHSVCLTANGEVYTFGCNDEGALGRPQTDDDSESPPAIVNLPERMVMISAGDSHTAALSVTGKVYLWGNFRNSKGAMGLTPDGKKQTTPVRILEDVRIVKIASGAEHLVCLSDDGDVYTCGCAESGQLGRITPRSAEDGGRTGGLDALLTPTVIVSRKRQKFDDIWTGSYNTFLHDKSSNEIYAFGLNNHNHLGFDNNDDREIARYFPKLVKSFQTNTKLISGGQHHTLSLDKSGHVHAVGRREYGRLGLGQNAGDANQVTAIPSLQSENCCDISCGNCVSFAVNTNGHVYSWGMGDSYQLGHGSEEDCFVPTIIKEGLASQHAFRVSGGGQHTLILAHARKG